MKSSNGEWDKFHNHNTKIAGKHSQIYVTKVDDIHHIYANSEHSFSHCDIVFFSFVPNKNKRIHVNNKEEQGVAGILVGPLPELFYIPQIHREFIIVRYKFKFVR